MSPTPDHPRPVRTRQAGRLADQPLDLRTVPDRTVLRTHTTGPVEHACEVSTWSCTDRLGRTAPWPSEVLAHQPEYELLASSPPRPRVAFESDGLVTRAQVRLPAGTSLYGAGELAGPLLRTGRQVTFWNTDAWCYGEDEDALYQSHPFVLALLPDGRATGILADCARRGTAALCEDGVEFAFEGGPFDVHLLDADHPREVARGLAALIGAMPLPPRWALGYHQCRWSYDSADEVREVARRLRAEGVPCDAIWLDIDYMDRFRVFTVDRERFPDLRGLTDELRSQGLRTVAILDPGLAADEEVELYRTARERGLLVTRAEDDPRPALGRVWPGICAFPDFTAPAMASLWAERVVELVRRHGIDGLWNDMNEPAVARSPHRTLPDGAWHPGAGRPHRDVHNLYGDAMVRATRAGLVAAHPDERPFVLTRAAHLATGGVAATWTGDNQSRWEDLAWAVPMVLNLGLCGQAFSGPDLGGFYGDPDEELFVRWYDLGAYLPFCRGHGEKTSARKEPWSLGPEALAHVRSALRRRMRLLPTLVALFEEAHRTGLPVARPLFHADPTDPALRAVDDAFLLGEDLLVAPVVERGAREREVHLPAGEWYAFPAGGERLAGTRTLPAPLGTTPVLARAGALVVLGSPLEHTGADDGLRELHVFLDARGRAAGDHVEDPGTASAAPGRRRLEVRIEGGALVLEVHGTVPGLADLTFELVLHGHGALERRFPGLGAVSDRAAL